MGFSQKLDKAILINDSLLCINLDPDPEKISGIDIFEFNKLIIDETYDLVCCYKLNSAFYEAEGAEGISQLKKTVDYIHQKDPGIPVILDGKRGYNGNTNIAYSKFAFDYIGADGLTLQPYLGYESLTPFFKWTEKGFFILCRTSNPGARELQDLEVASSKKPLYLHLAEQIATSWDQNYNVMLVVGATYPEELQKVRKVVGEMTILVPGIGAQGGDLEKTLEYGLNKDKKGLIIAVGRSIIYSEKVREEAKLMRDEINRYRNK